MKKGGGLGAPLPPSTLVPKNGVKKITAKIDTGRKFVVQGTLGTKTTAVAARGDAESAGSSSTFPRSQKRPLPPSKDPKVRAFVQANSRVSNMTALFHDEVDTQNISAALVKNARKSGVLNLSGRSLISVPLKVWRINELDETERTTVSVSLDDTSQEKWWEFVELQKLIIANNYVRDVPCDIANLQSLQTFDAHDNQIVGVSKDIGKLENLSKLDLSHNKLAIVPEEIGNLKRLLELKLSHNELDDLPGSFGNLSCLRVLDASNNKLTSFPGDFGFLSFLQVLNLSNNKLKEIPYEFGGLTGLRTLDLSDNCLKKIPETVADLIHLELLYLQRNKLEEIPDFPKTKNLKEIHLQNNLIRELHSEKFANTKLNLLDLRTNKVDTLNIDSEDFEFLERCYLDNNELAQLPDDLAALPSLKSLTLDGNPIRGIRLDILQRGTQEILKYLKSRLRRSVSSDREILGHDTAAQSLEAAFKSPPRKPPSRRSEGASVEDLGIDPFKCKASKTLQLASRKITDLEPGVFQLAAANSVTCIDLSKNSLTILPVSIDLCFEWLTELKIDFNRLIELPSCLAKCSRIQYLTAQNNLLSKLPEEFSHLKSLREINLGFNRFVTIPACLYEIPSLEIINMDSNKIVTLHPEKLEKLKRLATLDVRNNNIDQMPPEIGLLTQLKSLSIEGNPFRVPNYKTISQGTDSILAYLRNRIKQT